MPYDGSGGFQRVMNWANDALAGIKIKSDRHDTEDDNLASGLSNCITKDGQTQPTANLPLNGKRIVNLGAPVNPTDAATKASSEALGTLIHTAPEKTALVDADEFGFSDSEATPTTWARARVTWANIRASLVPVGSGMEFWGDTAPAGWLFCYGQAVSRTTYAKLFAVLDVAHGAGNGTTTFNLPDKRGRASAGKDDMGGTSANRLTGLAGGVNGDILGAVGGAEAHVLTIAQLPSHNHGGTSGGQSANHTHLVSGSTAAGGSHNHSISARTGGDGAGAVGANTNGGATFYTNEGGSHAHSMSFQSGTVSVGHTHSIPAQGSGTAHNTLPPTIICNYIIYAGV